MKVFEGQVVSVPGGHTAIVEVVRKTPHPLYKKLIKRSKKYKVDTAGLDVAIGANVKIVETRPISKNKFFKLVVKEEKVKKGAKKNDSA